MGHRRFLDEKHPFRFDVDKFGSTEFRQAPAPLSGEEVLECTKDIVTILARIQLERHQQGRNASLGSHWSFLKGGLFGLNFPIGKI
jgi:hypothetical protein